jgi:hypothetical protein
MGVIFLSEPPEVEKRFREKAAGRSVSPKVWADAWLLAFTQAAEGVLVTFDKTLGTRGARWRKEAELRLGVCDPILRSPRRPRRIGRPAKDWGRG